MQNTCKNSFETKSNFKFLFQFYGQIKFTTRRNQLTSDVGIYAFISFEAITESVFSIKSRIGSLTFVATPVIKAEMATSRILLPSF